jgi:hypothetical protein
MLADNKKSRHLCGLTPLETCFPGVKMKFFFRQLLHGPAFPAFYKVTPLRKKWKSPE